MAYNRQLVKKENKETGREPAEAVSELTTNRLSVYLRSLNVLDAAGVRTVSSRALAEPTPSRIRGLVTRIINERVQEGQLDECGLTLSELARIRESFIPVLTAIFHVRTPYPEDPRRRARADADLRKEST